MPNTPEEVEFAFQSQNAYCAENPIPSQTNFTISLSLSLSLSFLLLHHQHAYLMTAECEFPRGPFRFVSPAFTRNLDLFPLPCFRSLLQSLIALHPILTPEVRFFAFAYACHLSYSSFGFCFLFAFLLLLILLFLFAKFLNFLGLLLCFSSLCRSLRQSFRIFEA